MLQLRSRLFSCPRLFARLCQSAVFVPGHGELICCIESIQSYAATDVHGKLSGLCLARLFTLAFPSLPHHGGPARSRYCRQVLGLDVVVQVMVEEEMDGGWVWILLVRSTPFSRTNDFAPNFGKGPGELACICIVEDG